jgi:hypothetical protein
MREIKFRAWDSKNKKMIYFDLSDTIAPSQDHIMRCAGLKDINEEDYYEGDIFEDEQGTVFLIIPMLGGLSAINSKYYGQDHNELIAYPTNDAQTASWLSDCQIIGNIYEEPELLEVK